MFLYFVLRGELSLPPASPQVTQRSSRCIVDPLAVQEQCSSLQVQLHDLLEQRAGRLGAGGPPFPRKRSRRDKKGAQQVASKEGGGGEKRKQSSTVSAASSCSEEGSDESASSFEESDEGGNADSAEEAFGSVKAGRRRLWGTRVVQLRTQLEVAEAAQQTAEAARAAAEAAARDSMASKEAAEAAAQDLVSQLQEAERR